MKNLLVRIAILLACSAAGWLFYWLAGFEGRSVGLALLVAIGADVKAVAENMGHSDTTMIFRHYQHVLVRQREAALESVPELVIHSGNTNGHISAHFCMTDDEKVQ